MNADNTEVGRLATTQILDPECVGNGIDTNLVVPIKVTTDLEPVKVKVYLRDGGGVVEDKEAVRTSKQGDNPSFWTVEFMGIECGKKYWVKGIATLCYPEPSSEREVECPC